MSRLIERDLEYTKKGFSIWFRSFKEERTDFFHVFGGLIPFELDTRMALESL